MYICRIYERNVNVIHTVTHTAISTGQRASSSELHLSTNIANGIHSGGGGVLDGIFPPLWSHAPVRFHRDTIQTKCNGEKVAAIRQSNPA
jgi:hypothetical protein